MYIFTNQVYFISDITEMKYTLLSESICHENYDFTRTFYITHENLKKNHLFEHFKTTRITETDFNYKYIVNIDIH